MLEFLLTGLRRLLRALGLTAVLALRLEANCGHVPSHTHIQAEAGEGELTDACVLGAGLLG